MKLSFVTKYIVVAVLFLTANAAYSSCSQNDMNGTWWYNMSWSSGAARCKLVIQNGLALESKSVCVSQDYGQVDIEQTPHDVTFLVDKTCRVQLSILQSDEEDMSGWGWLTRDGEVLMGTMRVGQTGPVITVQALKMQ